MHLNWPLTMMPILLQRASHSVILKERERKEDRGGRGEKEENGERDKEDE